MASRSPRLRVVDPRETRRRRSPGPAVVAVVAYAAVFGAGLWLLRSRAVSRGEPPRSSAGPSAPAAPPSSRAALLEPSGLSPVARDEYFRQLSSECCSCGCDLTVRDCLLSDQKCSRSPEAASKMLDRLR